MTLLSIELQMEKERFDFTYDEIRNLDAGYNLL